MKYTRLGASGLKVSRLSLGAMGFGDPAWRSWVLAEDDAKPIIRRALDLGINLVDTCNFYSGGASELLIGRLLNGFVSRNELLIATKFGYAMGPSPNQSGYSRKNVVEAVDASLKRLGVDHIDLYQTHIWDQDTNIEELVVALADLVRSGKVLYVGAADMPTWQFVKAVTLAKSMGLPHFVSMHNHYNLIWRDAEFELLPFCRHENIGLLPYSPCARGFLSGKQRRTEHPTERAKTDGYATEWYNRPEDEDIATAVEDVASERGISPSQVAIAWVLAQPGVHSPVFGATKVEHVDEAVGALEVVLSEADIARLEQAYKPRMNAGH